MKKSAILICLLGAVLACSKNEDPVIETGSSEMKLYPVNVNLVGTNVCTKGTVANPNESKTANTLIHLSAVDAGSATIYQQTYQAGEQSTLIIYSPECDHIDITVESGAYEKGKFLKTIEGQREYFYSTGSTSVKWADVIGQTEPINVTLTRTINKVTIDKISVNWTNTALDSKELLIRKIFVCDAAREYLAKYANAYTIGYLPTYTGDKEGIKLYNLGGLDGFHMTESVTGKDFHVVTSRLDDLLLDEVNVAISKNLPYTTKHTFYTYFNPTTLTKPQIRNASDRANGSISISTSMTTIAIEAEMDGIVMYYRFPIVEITDTAPQNTHISISEVIITGLGSTSIYDKDNLANVSFTLNDWAEDKKGEVSGNV